MAIKNFQRTIGRVVCVTIVGALIGAVSALAQEVKPAEDKKFEAVDSIKPGNLIVAGYATPGTPLGPKLEGQAGKILGGTVYFAVFRRTAKAGNTWGISTNFDSHFVEGENIRRAQSPHLDTDAEYLYLYQVVNDRALQDPKLVKAPAKGGVALASLAVNANKKLTEDIASFALRLVLDPRQITSWGYFTETGFSLKIITDPKKPAERTVVAVSASPQISDTIYEDTKKLKEYRPGASSRRIDNDPKLSLGISSDTLNLKQSLNFVKNVSFVRFAALESTAKSGGRKPDFVQIVYADTPIAPLEDDDTTNGEPIRGIFKVDWKNVPMVGEGENSVIFGFTSDAPPIDQPIRIKDPEEAVQVIRDLDKEFRIPADAKTTAIKREKAGVQVAFASSNAAAVVDQPVFFKDAVEAVRGAMTGQTATSVAPAVGTNIPSPRSGGESPAVGGGGVMAPVVGGGTSGLGGGGGSTAAPPAGSLGAARSGGNGGGQGKGGGDSGNDQKQKEAATITNTNINTLTNSQLQAQLQGQWQLQFQAQLQAQLQKMFHGHGDHGDCCCPGGNVVPEPGALLLGLLGLPGLWYMVRRRVQGAAAVA